MPAQGPNACFTSRFENFPTSIRIPVGLKARKLYFLRGSLYERDAEPNRECLAHRERCHWANGPAADQPEQPRRLTG
jgi:hypothetical protein